MAEGQYVVCRLSILLLHHECYCMAMSVNVGRKSKLYIHLLKARVARKTHLVGICENASNSTIVVRRFDDLQLPSSVWA